MQHPRKSGEIEGINAPRKKYSSLKPDSIEMMSTSVVASSGRIVELAASEDSRSEGTNSLHTPRAKYTETATAVPAAKCAAPSAGVAGKSVKEETDALSESAVQPILRTKAAADRPAAVFVAAAKTSSLGAAVPVCVASERTVRLLNALGSHPAEPPHPSLNVRNARQSHLADTRHCPRVAATVHERGQDTILPPVGLI